MAFHFSIPASSTFRSRPLFKPGVLLFDPDVPLFDSDKPLYDPGVPLFDPGIPLIDPAKFGFKGMKIEICEKKGTIKSFLFRVTVKVRCTFYCFLSLSLHNPYIYLFSIPFLHFINSFFSFLFFSSRSF